MTNPTEPVSLDGDAGEEDERSSRRHALWAMVVLGCLAVIVGSLMVLLGGGGGTQHSVNLLPPVQTPTAKAPSTHQSAGGLSTAATASQPSTASAPSTPTSPPQSGDPCPSGASCPVDGDGGALAAVNAFRTQHGLAAVPGGVTRNAQLCAQHLGSGPTCVPHYAWTSLPTQDGAKAVAKIANFGRDWLLDKSTKTISVGWAYVKGQYECVLLKAP